MVWNSLDLLFEDAWRAMRRADGENAASAEIVDDVLVTNGNQWRANETSTVKAAASSLVDIFTYRIDRATCYGCNAAQGNSASELKFRIRRVFEPPICNR
ncbi:hypothetical protein [Caballeronia fortuita]|uniref:hypothetical protein n=1 Tax=Caballeronia fortuita TaxID=1777138 RepID=UPI0012FD25DA|nr:hypothetical protein [Caballeronia fortuita]